MLLQSFCYTFYVYRLHYYRSFSSNKKLKTFEEMLSCAIDKIMM